MRRTPLWARRAGELPQVTAYGSCISPLTPRCPTPHTVTLSVCGDGIAFESTCPHHGRDPIVFGDGVIFVVVFARQAGFQIGSSGRSEACLLTVVLNPAGLTTMTSHETRSRICSAVSPMNSRVPPERERAPMTRTRARTFRVIRASSRLTRPGHKCRRLAAMPRPEVSRSNAARREALGCNRPGRALGREDGQSGRSLCARDGRSV